MKRNLAYRFSALVALLLGLVVACAPAAAPTPTPAPKVVAPTPTPAPPTPTPVPYFAGKTIRIIVGFAPGGPSDIQARFTARFLGKRIPGNPTIIVENMPGAGSMTAANHLYKVAKPDGLTIGAFVEGMAFQQLLGAPGVEYDARKFNAVGAHVKNTSLCVARAETGFKSITEVVGSPRPLALGGTAPGADSSDWPKMLKAVLGANIKVVDGYGGLAPINTAVEGGELDGTCATWATLKTLKPEWMETGFVNALVQIAPKKHPDLPGVPLLADLVKTEEAKQLVKARTSILAWHQPFWLPPGVPREQVALLRKAFLDTLKDPEYLAEAKKAKFEIDPTPGEEMQKLIDELFTTPPEAVKKLAEILLPK